MHSLFCCFYTMFTLQCFCSREAILCNQEVACFVISIAASPEGRDGTVWTDFGSAESICFWYSTQDPVYNWKSCLIPTGDFGFRSQEMCGALCQVRLVHNVIHPVAVRRVSSLSLAGRYAGKISIVSLFSAMHSFVSNWKTHSLHHCAQLYVLPAYSNRR